MALPVLNHRIIQAVLAVELPRTEARTARTPVEASARPRLVLVHGRYSDDVTEFPITIKDSTRRVHVSDQHSVLGVVAAWQAHQTHAADEEILVVTTSLGDADLGWDLRGHAVRTGTITVDRAEIVMQRFHAAGLDPRIRQAGWLLDALIDAEPACGWRPAGAVLTLDAAMRALVGIRLGLTEANESALDAGTLLSWSRSATGPELFIRLPAEERAGITAWLTAQVGPSARLVLALVEDGRAADVLALGVVSSVVAQPETSADTAFALGGLLGSAQHRPDDLRAFTEGVQGALERWIAQAETRSPSAEQAGRLVLDVVQRADALAEHAGLTTVLATSRLLPSALRSQLRSLAAALTSTPGPVAVAAAEAALRTLHDHSLSRLDRRRLAAAEMGVRLLRWMALPAPEVTSVAAGVRGHFNDWGWVDRALAVIWAGESSGDPIVGNAYRALHDAVRTRRNRLDEQFAGRLVGWAAHASSTEPAGCLLVEDTLATIAGPLASRSQVPLVVVFDGMSSSVATELGEQILGQGWVECAPQPQRRMAAVSALPSVTLASRASLLTGGLVVGDQAVEKTGFAAFWRRQRRDAALFHKRDLPGEAGHRFSDALMQALAGPGVVGVVLNTIDEALRHGREGDRTEWRLEDVTYLPELLDAARGYRRPVVLVSDHGHVLDRSARDDGPTRAEGVQSARWRTGVPDAGEIEVAGPRVLYGNGRVVLPWQESIRYMSHKAGHHGGASLAEVTVPVMVLLPTIDLLPAGWSVLVPEEIPPAWWAKGATKAPSEAAALPAAPSSKPTGRRLPASGDSAAVSPSDADLEPKRSLTLGAAIVTSESFTRQRRGVPKAPDKDVVAGIIDALAIADGRLSLAAVCARAGRAGRSPEFFAAVLERLLNIEGYAVVSIIDGGRTVRLDVDLLRDQFQVAP